MFRQLLLLSLLLTLVIPATAETISIVTSDANAEPHYSDKVILAAGDVAEVIYNPNSSLAMEIKIGEIFVNETSLNNSDPLNMPKIAGPAELRVFLPPYHRSPYPYVSLTTFKITRAVPAATAMVPSTAVVIPNDAEGQFEVILESSIDMITWTPALPGTYAGDNPNRFFRTRIVKKP